MGCRVDSQLLLVVSYNSYGRQIEVNTPRPSCVNIFVSQKVVQVADPSSNIIADYVRFAEQKRMCFLPLLWTDEIEKQTKKKKKHLPRNTKAL